MLRSGLLDGQLKTFIPLLIIKSLTLTDLSTEALSDYSQKSSPKFSFNMGTTIVCNSSKYAWELGFSVIGL